MQLGADNIAEHLVRVVCGWKGGIEDVFNALCKAGIKIGPLGDVRRWRRSGFRRRAGTSP